MYRTSIRLPQRCTQRDNRNSLVFRPNAHPRLLSPTDLAIIPKPTVFWSDTTFRYNSSFLYYSERWSAGKYATD